MYNQTHQYITSNTSTLCIQFSLQAIIQMFKNHPLQVTIILTVTGNIKQNWNQFLIVVKATALKQQISKFYPQIQRTDASDHICVSQWPAINVKASFCA